MNECRFNVHGQQEDVCASTCSTSHNQLPESLNVCKRLAVASTRPANNS